ncbi:UxaA family hydrolase [Cupriavidus basilensis]|uniref:UxaA family hydrolase n=1 Tax=Cupriavidus basilensis TaxID=68895 RepID=UPI0020A652CB|nr:altronate dehydratase family protein [Cupriavidus basilensis]MCP3018132.1 altronate dehydratase family protein [Cupriavidus basilensis]
MNQPLPHLIIRLAESDNVVLARAGIAAGTDIGDVLAAQDIPAGHKLAARAIRKGEAVIKGGFAIGLASENLPAGTWVHSHNLIADDTATALRDASAPAASSPSVAAAGRRATFQGFVRADGRVATRNYIGVFVVGNCGATAARKVADWFTESRLAAYPNVDGVVPFVHEIGCGMEMTGEPMDLLRRTLSGTIRNPNIAGALVIALGCERNNIYGFLEQEKLAVGTALKTLVMQEIGGTTNTIEAGISIIKDMLPAANACSRQPVSAEHLVVGLQSAGADGFSAVSANPALGAAVDLLVAQGGTAILSETVDLVSLGHRFIARAATPEVAGELAQCVGWWEQYHAGRDTQLNRRQRADGGASGLSNALEKAASGVQRAGSSPVTAVYAYANPVTARGLVFMDAPSYEAVSATGQIAGGANLICLSTGTGSGFGALPAPTIKLASNTQTFQRMEDDLDIDCGQVLDGETTVAEMGQHIFAQMLRHASGEKTCSEALGVGENEFVPWPIGVLA